MTNPHADVAKARGLSARSFALPMAIALFSACGLGRAGAQSGKAPLASAADAADVSGAADSDTNLATDATADTDTVGLCKDLTCTDDNPCTTDTCEPLKGCIFKPVPDGEPCGYQGKALCNSGTCAAKGCGKMGGLQMGAPWPMEGACPSHSRQSAYLGPQTPKVKWVFTDVDWTGMGWLPWPEVVVGRGDVEYFGANGYIFAVDSAGALAWKQKVGPHGWALSSGAIGADDALYFAAHVNLVRVSGSGEQEWTVDLGLSYRSGPLIDGNGRVVVGSLDKHLYAINPNGEVAWKFDAGGMIYASPSADDAGELVVGSVDHVVRKLASSGYPVWSFEAAGSISAAAPIGADAHFYVLSNLLTAGSDQGRIYSFGRDAWEYIPTGNQTIAYSDSIALAPDGLIYHSGHCVEAISPAGQQVWDFNDGSGSTDGSALHGCTPATIGADGTIYVAQSWARCSPPGGKGQPACHNDLYALNPDGSLKWHWQTPDKPTNGLSLTPPVLGANGTLYVLWTAGYLYAFAD